MKKENEDTWNNDGEVKDEIVVKLVVLEEISNLGIGVSVVFCLENLRFLKKHCSKVPLKENKKGSIGDISLNSSV